MIIFCTHRQTGYFADTGRLRRKDLDAVRLETRVRGRWLRVALPTEGVGARLPTCREASDGDVESVGSEHGP